MRERFEGEFEYLGCDLSSELLKHAHKDNPNMRFETGDMLTFLEQQEQESFDVVIGIASIQHLPDDHERLLLMKYVYRVLTYNGMFLMVNWAFSMRFLRKHWKIFLKSLGQVFLSL